MAFLLKIYLLLLETGLQRKGEGAGQEAEQLKHEPIPI